MDYGGLRGAKLNTDELIKPLASANKSDTHLSERGRPQRPSRLISRRAGARRKPLSGVSEGFERLSSDMKRAEWSRD